jgi:hypothetical protein
MALSRTSPKRAQSALLSRDVTPREPRFTVESMMLSKFWNPFMADLVRVAESDMSHVIRRYIEGIPRLDVSGFGHMKESIFRILELVSEREFV